MINWQRYNVFVSRAGGLIRYIKGYKRGLTNSELSRGYLFISTDKKIRQLAKLEIFVGNKKFKRNQIDKYGRIMAGKVLLSQAQNKKLICKLKKNTLVISLV